MNFICETCNFKSETKQNYTRHCQTKKHLTLCGECVESVVVTENITLEKMNYELRIRELEISLKYEKEKNELLLSLLNKQPTVVIEQPKPVEQPTPIVIEQPKPVEQPIEQPKPFVEEMKEIKIVKKEKKIEEQIEEVKPKKRVLMKDFLKDKCEDAWCFEELMCNANESITLDFLKSVYNNGKHEDPYFKPSNYFEFLSYVMSSWNLDKYTRPFHVSDINRQVLFVNNHGKWDDIGEKQLAFFTEKMIPRQLNKMFIEKIEELEENMTKEEYNYVKRYFVMFNPLNRFNKESYTLDNCPIHENFTLENCYMPFFEKFYLPESDRY